MGTVAQWDRYVALGDPLTGSPRGGATSHTAERGWAQRLALILDGGAGLTGHRFSFSDLTQRGSRVLDVVHRQIPRALREGADLVSILIGASDVMSPTTDLEVLARRLETGVARLRASGSDVLLATSFDPRFAPFLRPHRERAATFNGALWSIAREHGTIALDLWGAPELQTASVWHEEQVQLTPDGHRMLAHRAAHVLGVPYFEVTSI